MKKFLLFILSIIAIATSNAQPNFTSADMPNIGDQDTLMILQYQPLNNNLETETGNGYNWDFSDLPFSTLNLMDVDSFRNPLTNVSTFYPGSTIEEYKYGITGQTVNLYSYSNDTLIVHRLGDISNGWALGPMASIAFPIVFSDSSVVHANIYTGSNLTNLVGERKTTVTYDGFGTLDMPNGASFNNVFRVKQIERDTSYVVNTVASTTSYLWYKQGGQVPLLRLVYTGAANLYFVFGSKANGTASGTSEIEQNATFTIYPNPSDGHIQLVLDQIMLTNNNNIEIYNTLGEIVYQSMITNRKSNIDLSQLMNGVYSVRISNGKSVSIKTIIKE